MRQSWRNTELLKYLDGTTSQILEKPDGSGSQLDDAKPTAKGYLKWCNRLPLPHCKLRGEINRRETLSANRRPLQSTHQPVLEASGRSADTHRVSPVRQQSVTNPS